VKPGVSMTNWPAISMPGAGPFGVCGVWQLPQATIERMR
jgi:hypothetical protein